jgi:hypothetical protein
MASSSLEQSVDALTQPLATMPTPPTASDQVVYQIWWCLIGRTFLNDWFESIRNPNVSLVCFGNDVTILFGWYQDPFRVALGITWNLTQVGRLDLSVQTLNGDTITLIVNADESIDSIKGKILHLLRTIFTQPSDFDLFYLEELLLGSLLSYPDILNGSMLRMVSTVVAPPAADIPEPNLDLLTSICLFLYSPKIEIWLFDLVWARTCCAPSWLHMSQPKSQLGPVKPDFVRQNIVCFP